MASETLKMALMQSAKEEYLTIDIASETENWVPSDAFMKQMDALRKEWGVLYPYD